MSDKIIIVGDIHFRGKKLKDISHAWKNLVEWANKNRVSLIACCGDVFDSFQVGGRNASTGLVYKSFLSPFHKDKPNIKFISIVGNHDLANDADFEEFNQHLKECLEAVNLQPKA